MMQRLVFIPRMLLYQIAYRLYRLRAVDRFSKTAYAFRLAQVPAADAAQIEQGFSLRLGLYNMVEME